MGDYDGAIIDYNKALELNPKKASSYNYRGATYLKLKNYKQAIADYDQAIAIGGPTFKPDLLYRDEAVKGLNTH